MTTGFALMLERPEGTRYLSGYQPGDYLWVPAEKPNAPRRFHTAAEAEAVRVGCSAARVVHFPDVVETFFLLHCPTCAFWCAEDIASAYDFQRLRESHDATCPTPAVMELRREVPRPYPPRPRKTDVSVAEPIFVGSKP